MVPLGKWKRCSPTLNFHRRSTLETSPTGAAPTIFDESGVLIRHFPPPT